MFPLYSSELAHFSGDSAPPASASQQEEQENKPVLRETSGFRRPAIREAKTRTVRNAQLAHESNKREGGVGVQRREDR